jgi:hypothetical protein
MHHPPPDIFRKKVTKYFLIKKLHTILHLKESGKVTKYFLIKICVSHPPLEIFRKKYRNIS